MEYIKFVNKLKEERKTRDILIKYEQTPLMYISGVYFWNEINIVL